MIKQDIKSIFISEVKNIWEDYIPTFITLATWLIFPPFWFVILFTDTMYRAIGHVIGIESIFIWGASFGLLCIEDYRSRTAVGNVFAFLFGSITSMVSVITFRWIVYFFFNFMPHGFIMDWMALWFVIMLVSPLLIMIKKY